MTISIKHKFVNPKSDTADASVTRASNWNDEHEMTLAQNRVLGRISAANGPVEELTGEQVRTISDTLQAGVLSGVNTRTASYTLVSSDRGKVIEMNVAGANTVTIPNETGIGGVNFPIGTQITVVQIGLGQTTAIPAPGVNLQAVGGGSKTTTRYSGVFLYKRGPNAWIALDQPYANANASAAAASATAAAASASLAGDRADDIAALASFRDYANLATLRANTSLTYTAGQPLTVVPNEIIRTRAEGYAYKVAASAATDHHISTAGGIKLYVVPGQSGYDVKAFGAVGDGVADDTIAVQAALNSEKPLDWGGFTYRITNTVSRTYTSDIYWEGRNATILYDGSHVERAVLIQGRGIDIVLNDLTFDGQKLCNTVLSILNDSDSYANLTCSNVFVTRAKRLATLNGGEGMLVRGSYNQFSMNGGGASDCEMPVGQGTPSVQGIAGIVAIFYSATRYIKAMHVNNVRVEKIYSSDLSYQPDQDGILYFAPTVGTLKVPSLFTCYGSEFVNCYGRSIKTQCRNTVVKASSFVRTEGLASGFGNGEIDAQTGHGNFRDLAFSYSNGYEPGVCVNVSSLPGNNALLVDGCTVTLDNTTVLSFFAGVYPRDTSVPYINKISNNKIFGPVKGFFSFLCNSDKNHAEITNNFIQKIENGETSEKALVYVKISGTTPPHLAYITAFDNVYAGTDLPALVRDSIPGNSMVCIVSAWSNYGFETNAVNIDPSANGLKTNAIARLSKYGGNGGGGYMLVDSFIINGNSTRTVDISNDNKPAFVFILAQFDNLSYAFFANSSTGNVGLNVGARFVLGNTTDPGSGIFRVWSNTQNQITISNTNASARAFSLFAMVSG